jgi:nucleoside-diphosphate kinase
VEKTFAIIKPNAVKANKIGKILAMVEDGGFKIVAAKMKTLSKSEAEGFYAEHKARPFFGSLVSFMTSGPVLVLAFQRENAVEEWRKLMGATDPAKAAPQTVRKLYGESLEANSVHGSDSPASAARELNFFFEGELK